MKSKLRHTIANVLIVSVFTMGLPVPAQAGVVGYHNAASDRERVAALIEREEVRVQLAARGVDADEAKLRVAALTDSEVSEIARRMDSLAAGGDPVTGVFYLAFLAVAAVVLIVMGTMKLAGAIATSVQGGLQGQGQP